MAAFMRRADARGRVDAKKVDVDALAEPLKALANPKRLALLRFLREPHYLEEIASELKMSRQAAQEHVALLVEAGLLEKAAGERPSGPVVEYRLVRQRYFSLFEDLRVLGATLPEADAEALQRTLAGPAQAPGARAEQAELLVVGGFSPGLCAPLQRGSAGAALVLGRDPASGLVLDWDLMVSNRHAEVRPQPKGHLVVDLFSRNGTYLNGTRIPGGTPVPMRSGDLLQVGRTMVVYRD